MKLVEILARELEEWPSVDDVECGFIVQECDGELYTTHDKPPTHTGGNSWWRQDDDDGECGYLDPTVFVELAGDWTTAIITREMWQAERDRIAGKVQVSAVPDMSPWEVKVMPKSDDPRTMRDRIREIDATTIALSEERVSLVAKLKAEGFILASEWSTLEPSEIQVETRRVEDIAQQDMSDPANWRVGDIFVIVENKQDDHEFLEGTIVRFTGFDDGAEDYIGTFEYQDGRDYWFCRKESVKFYSRPAT